MRSWQTALVFVLAAASAQARPVLKDIQPAHGQMGPERKGTEYIRGDEVLIRFTISDLQTDKEGKVRLELTVARVDGKGKAVESETVPVQNVLALGGDSMPAVARTPTQSNTPLGEHALRVTVADKLAGESASFDFKYTVKEEEFALVVMRFYQDREGRVAAPVGGQVGQTVFFQMRGVGFDRSDDAIDLELAIQVFDAAGKPMMPKPLAAPIQNSDAKVIQKLSVLPLRGEVTLNRAGDFKLRISLTDRRTKKTTTFETPLRVTTPGS